MADDKQIQSLTAMAARIRAVGSDQLKLEALAASLDDEARLLRDGPDPEPLTEAEKALIVDPITGDRVRIFLPQDIKAHRARAIAEAERLKKAEADRVAAEMRAAAPVATGRPFVPSPPPTSPPFPPTNLNQPAPPPVPTDSTNT